MKSLEELFKVHNCDKGSKHKYHLIYDGYFTPRREDPIKILELGVYKGASTRALLDYFPNATIHGVDIFDRLNPEDTGLLDHERVDLFKADTTAPDLVKSIREKYKNIKYDFIIDDAHHTPLYNRLTLENTEKLLKKSGVYFIEDVWPWDIMTPQEKNHPWIQRYPDRYNDQHFDRFFKSLSGWNVTRYDHRELTGQDDSYIITLTR